MAVASTFEIFAAIDLRGGRVVRLKRGDFHRETVFGDDPLVVAGGFASAGARWLHVVDLDGARTGVPAHDAVIRRIIATLPSVAVEVAGGRRDDASVASILEAGAARVVIGTRALADPAFARRLVERHGTDRIAVAIDVRAGRAVGHGWAEGTTGVDAEQAIDRLSTAGITTFEVTAIERDGMSGGPDLDLLGRLARLDRGAIVASGGIASIKDIRAVRAIGCTGAILGRALYEGRLDLAAAIHG